MFQTVVLLVILAVLASASVELPEVKIIGGTPASHGQFPYQVAIEYNGRQHCGGSILSSKVVLTAAHCLDRISPSKLAVLAGTVNRLSGGVRSKIASYVKHERYTALPLVTHDIAILHLQNELPLNTTIKVANLPAQNEQIHSNEVAAVSGWGAEYHQGPSSHTLKYVNIPLWSRDECKKAVPHLHTSHLCAGDAAGQRNSCPGDSGGPLSVGGKVVGVVSYGFGCGAYRKPAMYTYVGGFRDWLQKHGGV